LARGQLEHFSFSLVVVVVVVVMVMGGGGGGRVKEQKWGPHNVIQTKNLILKNKNKNINNTK
jgi:hypothetical protein